MPTSPRPDHALWSDLSPIESAIKPDAQPEIFCQDAPTADERYYVPLSETVGSRPLWISPRDNRWADILWARSAGLVNRHYHPHEVFDVHDYLALCREHYEANGIGAAYVDQLLR